MKNIFIILFIASTLASCSIAPTGETLSKEHQEQWIENLNQGFWKMHPCALNQPHSPLLQLAPFFLSEISRVKILKTGDALSDIYLNNASYGVKPGDAIADNGKGRAFRIFFCPMKQGPVYLAGGTLMGGINLQVYVPVFVTNNFEGTGEDRIYTGPVTLKKSDIKWDFSFDLANSPQNLFAVRVSE